VTLPTPLVHLHDRRARARRWLARSAAAAAAVLLISPAPRAQSAAPAAPAGPATIAPPSAPVPPETFFGFRMGTDGRLAAWPDIERYFTEIAAASDRVELVPVGTTTEGRRSFGAVVSAPENVARLEEIRQQNLRLADPRTLSPREAAALAETQPLVLVIGASIHATEIGATQTANELLFELATSQAPDVVAALRSLVIVVVPSLNPDGHHLVVDWFTRHRGTPFENSPMPWLYHKYAGHDINRDAFMLNLAENQALANFFYRRWHPQVFLTMHQMGPRGPRFFVPPNYDPIDPNYDPLLWRASGLLGHAMAMQLERDGRSGVVQNALFDYYWPGYEDSAPLGHNIVCLLTEVASARLSLPIDVSASDLAVPSRGLPEYRPQVNFPNPWPGGTWRLRDIVDYELSAVRGLLAGASRFRRELLENFYDMGRRAVERGREGTPFAFLIPPDQHDPHAAARLVDLLVGGAVEVHEAIEPFRAGSSEYPTGTRLVLMAQPFRAFAKTLLERQDYPVRRLSVSGPPERPYDVAGWTLPFQMGVSVDPIEQPFALPALSRLDGGRIAPGTLIADRRASHFVIDARGNAGALAINRLHAAGAPVQWTLAPVDVAGRTFAAGSLVVPASSRTRPMVERLTRELGLDAVGTRGRPAADLATVERPRIGLYKPWVENIDEGWTRWLLEHYEFRFVSLTDSDLRTGRLRDRVDLVILPDAAPDRLIAGHAPGTMPEPYTGGIGQPGVAALRAFVDDGGSVVCFDSSCAVAIEAFRLPIADDVRELGPERFFCPGSILRLRLDPTHPLAFGMPEHTTAFFANSSAYLVDRAAAPADGGRGPGVAPARGEAVRALAWYGSGNPLLSGWLEGPEYIADKAAVVEARVGAGRAVLMGFRVQHRAQTLASFRLLFNSFYTQPPLPTRPLAEPTAR
jgi:hypothetical protein